MADNNQAPPEDRCKFELSPADVGYGDLRSENWHRKVGAASCYREVWRDDRCIWHADVEDKPVAELKAAREECDGHLDGAILRDITLGDTLSFANCSLVGATIEGVDLSGGDFRNVGLLCATVRDSDLSGARFDDATLSGAECPESAFVDASFRGADLRAASFAASDCSGGDFTDARLGGGRYDGFDPGVDLPEDLVETDQSLTDFAETVDSRGRTQAADTWEALAGLSETSTADGSDRETLAWTGYPPPESRHPVVDASDTLDASLGTGGRRGTGEQCTLTTGSGQTLNGTPVAAGEENDFTATTGQTVGEESRRRAGTSGPLDRSKPVDSDEGHQKEVGNRHDVSEPHVNSMAVPPDRARPPGGSEPYDATTHPKITFYDAFKSATEDAPDGQTDGDTHGPDIDGADAVPTEASSIEEPGGQGPTESDSGVTEQREESDLIGEASLGPITGGAESDGSEGDVEAEGDESQPQDESILESVDGTAGAKRHGDSISGSSTEANRPSLSGSGTAGLGTTSSDGDENADQTEDHPHTDAGFGTSNGESDESGDGTEGDPDTGAEFGTTGGNGEPSNSNGFSATSGTASLGSTLQEKDDSESGRDGENDRSRKIGTNKAPDRGSGPDRAIDARLGTIEVGSSATIPDEEGLGVDFEDAMLDGAVFRDATLGWASFVDATLTDAEFDGATLAEADFHRATMRGTTLADCDLRKTSFEMAVLADAEFDRGDTEEASLAYADAARATLRDVDLRTVDLSGASLPAATLSKVRLDQVSLPGNLDLSEATIDRVDMEETTVPDLNLRATTFESVNLYRASFEGTALERATIRADTNLIRAEFHAVSLRQATLRNASFYLGTFDGVDLQGAVIEDVDLSDIRIDNSRLIDATFRTCELDESTVAYSDIRTAAFLDQTNLEAATFRRSDLFGARFEGCDMYRATFTDGVSLRHATIGASSLPETTFEDIDLEGATFEPDTVLRNAHIRGVSCPGVDFAETELDGVRFEDVVLDGADLSAASLRRVWFESVSATEARFTEADLTCASFADGATHATPEPSLRGADFTDATLREARFGMRALAEAVFRRADLTDATFESSAAQERPPPERANLEGVNLRGGDLTGAILDNAALPGSNLAGADLSDATARRADFRRANLHNTSLVRVDCRGATFDRALLYDALLADVQIDTETSFSPEDPESTFTATTPIRDQCVYESFRLAPGQLDTNTSQFTAAIWVYRRLEGLHDDNALSTEARTFHISKEEAERQRSRLARDLWLARRAEADPFPHTGTVLRGGGAIADAIGTIAAAGDRLGQCIPFTSRSSPSPGFESSTETAAGLPGIENESRFTWLTKSLMKRTTAHGESAWQVVKSSAVIVLVSAVAFWLAGIRSKDGTVYALDGIGEVAKVAGWRDFFLNLYFSLTTFSTIGYGSLSPHGPWSRLIVAVESIAGGVLIALLIFVLSRRVSR